MRCERTMSARAAGIRWPTTSTAASASAAAAAARGEELEVEERVVLGAKGEPAQAHSAAGSVLLSSRK